MRELGDVRIGHGEGGHEGRAGRGRAGNGDILEEGTGFLRKRLKADTGGRLEAELSQSAQEEHEPGHTPVP